MKKIFFLLISIIFLTACQNNQPKKEDVITNQYHFYQGSINSAEKAKQQLENTNIDINAD